MKIGIITFLVTCCAILLSGCKPATPEEQTERRQFFLACLERTTVGPGINKDDIVAECKSAAIQLY